MTGVEVYLFAALLILVMISIYFMYNLFRITHLRSWWLVILGFGLLVAWRLLVLMSLVSAWVLVSNIFLLLVLGPLALGLWQLKQRLGRIYRHVNEAN